MNPISAEEWELLNFFEVEPQLRDRDVVWLFNDAAYVVDRDGLSLSVAIAPSYRDVRVVLRSEDRVVFELNAPAVRDVRVQTESGQAFLEIVVDDNNSLRVHVRPDIRVTATARGQA